MRSVSYGRLCRAFDRSLRGSARCRLTSLISPVGKRSWELNWTGSQHLDEVDYDTRRTTALGAQGWTIIRLWNSDVLSNPEGVATYVLEKAAECLGGTLPLPCREGRVSKPRF